MKLHFCLTDTASLINECITSHVTTNFNQITLVDADQLTRNNLVMGFKSQINFNLIPSSELLSERKVSGEKLLISIRTWKV